MLLLLHAIVTPTNIQQHLDNVYCGVFTPTHIQQHLTVHENVGVLKEVVRISVCKETTSNSLSIKC